MGYGIDFDGSNDVIHIDNSQTSGHILDITNGPFTLEGWFSTRVYSTAKGTIVSKRDGLTLDQYQLYIEDSSGRHVCVRGSGEWGYGADTGLALNTWYYAASVINNTNYPEIFRDGALKTWTNKTGYRPFVFTHRERNVSIGARWESYPTTGYQFDGMLDEVRISKIDRSSGWLFTTYNNYNDPGSFFILGLEELNPSLNYPPQFYGENPLDWSTGISINQATVNVTIQDTDLFNWTIGGVYVNDASGTNEANGSKQATLITPLPSNTEIIWYVNATDGEDFTNETYRFTTEITWYDLDWMYRRIITIDHTDVPADLVNFPFLIDITNGSIGIYAQTDGDDFVFTDSYGNTLHHEIEYYDNSIGHLIAWVNVTDLSSTEDTVLVLYYGNSMCSNQEHPTDVWDGNYLAVWHLKEDPGIAGTGGIKDSTSHANHGTAWGSMTSADQVAGKIGYGIDFDGSNDVIHIDNSNGVDHNLDLISGPFTLEAWFNTPLTSNQGTLINKRDGTDKDQYQFYLQPYLFIRANKEFGGGTEAYPTINTWHYGAVIVNDTNWPEIYRNAIKKTWADGGTSAGPRPYDFIHRDVNVSIGARWENYPTTAYRYTGIIDEVRISNIDRSSDWLLTIYNNYNNPGAFITLGDEQSRPGNLPPIFTNEQPQHQTSNVEITQVTVSVLINDTNGDAFDWTIEGQYVTTASGNDEGNGTKIANLIIPLPYYADILWYVNATDGTAARNATYVFTTRLQFLPNPPADFSATPVSDSQIDLSWTPGSMADTTYVERNSVASWTRGEGTMIYNTSGNSYSDTALDEATTYYYQAWSWNATDHVFSTGYASDDATTLELVLLSEWPYRKAITINHSQVLESHTNFPVLLQIHNDLDLVARAQGDFDDILFTDDTVSWTTGYTYQRLAHQIEVFDSVSGNLTVWVNVSRVSSSTDTVLYMYYGNATCDSQQQPLKVWDASYHGVWHLHNDFLDSTSFRNDGTNHGSTDVPGWIGDSQYFDGNDYINASNHCLGAINSWTASCWINSNTSSTNLYHYFLSTGNYDAANSVNIWQNNNNPSGIGEIRAQIVDSGGQEIEFATYGGTNYNDNLWHLVHVTWDASTHNLSLFVDGALEHSEVNTNVDTGSGSSNDLTMGQRNDHVADRALVGWLDEVRISNPIRNASWIATEYNNQYDPSTFYNVGPQEPPANYAPEFSYENPVDDAFDVDILLSTVNVTIKDRDGDLFNWTIQGLHVTNAGNIYDGNGSKQASVITPLPYASNIVWYVNATDGAAFTYEIYNFTTRAQYLPDVPSGFSATAMNRNRIDLGWTIGNKADTTYIERNLVSSWNRGEGALVYNGSGTSYSDMGLSENVHYYYQAWSWNETDDVFSSTFTAADATTFANQLPVFSGETPADNSGNVAITYPSVSVLIEDPEGDLFDWTIEGQYVTSASANDASNGTKSANLMIPLPYSTDIVWYVNATDGYGWTRMVYNFTTVSNLTGYPTVTLLAPADDSTLEYDDVIFNSSITDGIGIKNASLYTNISGTWQLMDTKSPPADEYEFSSSMELWMHFNKDPAYGETETHIYDFSGKNHNGTATDGAASSTSGKYGGAYTLDGENDVIRLPSGTYDLPGKTGATMAAWVKRASGQVDVAGTVLFIDTGVAATSARLLLSVNNDGTVSVKARSNLESPLPTFTSIETIPVDTWTHIVGVVNLTSDTALIYINGQLSRSGTLAFVDPSFATTTCTNAGIGGIYTSTVYSYKGMIDESAIFTRVLSPTEIQELYLGKRPTQWNVSFTVNDIPQGTYEWNCQAYDVDGLSSFASNNWQFTIETLLIPSPPSGFIATPISQTQIDLTWNKGSLADKTYIERNLISTWNRGEGTIIYNDTTTSYSDLGLSENTHYYYQAWSWNQTYQTFSATSSATNTTTSVSYPTVILTAPLNNSLIDHSDVTFNCTATDNSTGIKNVSLYSNIGGSWHLMETKTFVRGEYQYHPLMELWLHFNKDPAYGETDTNLYDFSGKNHNGTATGGAAYTSAGKYNGAYSFDGTDDVIRLTSGNYSLSGQTGATMAAWVKPAAGQTAPSGTILFIDRAGTSATRMLISVNNNQTVSVKGRSADETFQVCTSTQTIPYDTWSHVVGVINLTSNTMQLYINGVLDKIQTMAFTQNYFATSTATNPGLGGIYGVPNYYYKGLIDETTMIPRALSASEAQELYNGSDLTSCNVSFSVTDIPEGTYQWNCLVYNNAGFSAWAQENWTLNILPSLTIQYVDPTPSDGETLYTQTTTINVSANRNITTCVLSLLSDGVNNNSFTITMSQSMVDRWGFKYPVTYIFNLSNVPVNAEVLYRTRLTDPWQPLVKKTEHDLFNGIECVRFNSSTNQAFVSVRFNTTDTIYLKFNNVSVVTYDSIAKYYDNRKAAYTLSNDNWGRSSSAHPGATWLGMTNDASDSYQASVHAVRMFNIPISIAINSRMAGGASMWARMQDELNYHDYSWEPAVHTRTHPCSASAYLTNGYTWEILGCRNDILENLTNIPFGPYVSLFILPCGYEDGSVESTAAHEFLFLRDWTGSDHPASTIYSPWNTAYNYYGIGGLETKAYDVVFQSRSPAGRYYASDVANLNNAFTTVYNNGGIFYAMFHSDRYSNSVIYDPSPGVDGVSGSSLMQHLSYIANWTDVWYVANGWLYSYHYVAENAVVTGGLMNVTDIPMTVVNNGENTYAYTTLTNLINGTIYNYYVTANDSNGNLVRAPHAPAMRSFRISEPSSWWNAGWEYRKEIIIDHTKVAGNLTNFPMLITLASDADLANKTQPDGDDIVFTMYDGTRLAHEIELYNNTTGQLVAWVNIPALSSALDTLLYLYYGNNACENQQDLAGTWGTQYRMVHHLNETSGTHIDSTTYSNDGTYHGSNQNAAGIIDGADQFIGDLGNVPGGDYIDCGNDTSLNLNAAITVSSWIKPTTDQINWNHLCTKGANSPNRVYQLSIEANETIDFIINGDSTNARATTLISVPINQWSYITGTYDGSTIKVYINGVLQAIKSYNTPISTNQVHLFIAGRVNGVGNTGDPIYTFNGVMDEVRISDNAHSAEWIFTEYNNQNNPGGFFQLGTEEHKPQLAYVYRIQIQSRWNIIAMPFNKALIKTDINISYNGTEYTWDQAVSNNIILGFIYGWNRTGNSYQLDNTLEPGNGYWLWAYHPCELVLTLDGAYQDASQITLLKQRWNIMGLPYNTSLAKQDIIVQYNGSEYTWEQATSGSTPIILGFIYGWNSVSQFYTLADYLNAGYGYWMYAYEECILKT
ncbi:MAG: DUF2341 domain-containing protein [Candidatus Thermoplasmatota archaeon]